MKRLCVSCLKNWVTGPPDGRSAPDGGLLCGSCSEERETAERFRLFAARIGSRPAVYRPRWET